MYKVIPMLKTTNSMIIYFDFTVILLVRSMINQKQGVTTNNQYAGMIFFFSKIVNYLLVSCCMLPKLDEIRTS